MCLIIASPTGKPIPAEYITDAAGRNRDGCGVAWVHDGQIHWRKGLDDDGAIAVLKDERPDGAPHVFHARISTIGGTPHELTHPFPITEDVSLDLTGSTDKLLFHNGMFSSWKQTLLESMLGSGTKAPGGGHWSDTRAMALLCHIHGPNIIAFLDTTSRYLVFDATAPKPSRMKLWGDWHTHEDFKFSNRGASAFTVSSFRQPVTSEATGATTDTAPDMSATTTTNTRGNTHATSPSETPSRRYRPSTKRHAWSRMTPRGTEIANADQLQLTQ